MSVQDTHREREVTLLMSDVIVKAHECPFSVEIGEQYFVRKKRGNHGNASDVTDDRGQLGHIVPFAHGYQTCSFTQRYDRKHLQLFCY